MISKHSLLQVRGFIICGLCDVEEQDIKNSDIHTLTCSIHAGNFCHQVSQTIREINANINKQHNGNGTMRHFYCERGDKEFFQDKFHIERDLFEKIEMCSIE